MKKDKLNRFNPKFIEPKGWILHQLQTQMNGLSGHLHEFWPDIADSGWIGGKADSWERVPYWLDGYIPLAYLLDDKKAIKNAKFYVESILSRQQEDGWIAPRKCDRAKYDVWGIFIMLKALLQYAEINNSKKAYQGIYDALKALNEHLDHYPLFNWGKFRWFEALISLFAIYKKHKESWLLDLAKKLHDQGFDYFAYYQDSLPKSRIKTGDWRLDSHVVNNAMAIKCYGLYYQLTGDKKELRKVGKMLSKINKYHGAVTGVINGDECLAGLSPIQGSELCSIVELMFSLETLARIDGSSKYQEQLERLAFNALPSAATNDMWAHQYVNQVNAPFIKKDKKFIWTTNGPETNLYGLQPHCGCCTSNMHQGWPKFVESVISWNQRTLQINSYVPIKAKNRLYEIEISSFYPFEKKIHIKIDCKKKTHLKLLIPHWSLQSKINGQEIASSKNGFYECLINEGQTELDVSFESKPIWAERKYGISLVDGPLVYALKVEQEKVRINADDPRKAFPHADYEFHNRSDFAYGIVSKEFQEKMHDIDKNQSIFVNETTNKSIYVEVVPIEYRIIGNYIKMKGIPTSKKKEIKEFIPIGVNKLRMGELPYLESL